MGKVSPTQALSAAGYLLAWKIVGWLPHKLARSLFDIGARVAWRRAQRGSGLSGLSSNLEAILGKQRVNDALLLAAVRSYARYWCEAFRLPKLVASPSRKRTLLQTLDASVRGQQHLDASVAEPIPVTGTWLAYGWPIMLGNLPPWQNASNRKSSTNDSSASARV